jgi:molybdopterin biosynthesis enzyme MoaB
MTVTTTDVERMLTGLGAELRQSAVRLSPAPSDVTSDVITAFVRVETTRAARDARRTLQEALAAAQDEVGTLAALTSLRMQAALDPRIDEEVLHTECLRLLELGGIGCLPQDQAVDAVVAMLEGWQQRQQLDGTGRLAVA